MPFAKDLRPKIQLFLNYNTPEQTMPNLLERVFLI
jgi:hypothetical protein